MPDLYAYRLPLVGGGPACFDDAVGLVVGEVGDRAGVRITDGHGSAIGAGAATLRWRTASAPACDDRVWTLLWETPISGDPDTCWAMTVKVALDGGQASLIVRWGIVSRDLRMRRVELGLEPPPLLLAALNALVAEEDGQPIDGEPAYACDPESAGHLGRLLLDPRRILPVVALSSVGSRREAEEDAEPLVDPRPIARALVGVAHVVVVDSTHASRALSGILGPRFTVFGGAVRLYWPGLRTASEPLDHPLWLPDAVREHTSRSLRRELLDQVMPMAVIRFSTAEMEARIGLAAERRRRAELRELSARVREESNLGVDWEHELEMAWSENERLREDQARLTAQLSAAHDNLRALAVRWPAPPRPDPIPPEPSGSDEPGSVLDAVERAVPLCSGLVFLGEAFASARRATYRQPDRVLRALVAMNGAVVAWQHDQLEGGFRMALAAQGLDYSPGVSASTVGRFPQEYERTYQGRRIVLGPHIRLGRGSPEACCRMYFYLDGEAHLGVVGHVGNHLSDRTTG